MGLFSSIKKGIKGIAKGIGKVFKSIGKGIKKVVGKVGKAFGKLGVVGSIALAIFMPYAIPELVGWLGTVASGSSAWAGVANVALKTINLASQFGSKVGNVFGTLTKGVSKFIGDVAGATARKLGMKVTTKFGEAGFSGAFKDLVTAVANTGEAAADIFNPATYSWSVPLPKGDVGSALKGIDDKPIKAVDIDGNVATSKAESIITPPNPAKAAGDAWHTERKAKAAGDAWHTERKVKDAGDAWHTERKVKDAGDAWHTERKAKDAGDAWHTERKAKDAGDAWHDRLKTNLKDNTRKTIKGWLKNPSGNRTRDTYSGQSQDDDEVQNRIARFNERMQQYSSVQEEPSMIDIVPQNMVSQFNVSPAGPNAETYNYYQYWMRKLGGIDQTVKNLG